jgi:APA family basic amino acid/polyamine antiporter
MALAFGGLSASPKRRSASARTVAASPSLRRTLGVWRVSLTGIGVILGAGVYALIGPAAAQAGNAMWLSFVLAGITAGLTAYSYARFAALRPKDSPEFQYTAMAFGPATGFVAGWLMLAADLLAAATVALGFGGYWSHLFGTPAVLNALALLGVTTLILCLGIAGSVALAIVLTFVEAAGLLFVIVVGLPFWPKGNFLEMPQGLGGVWNAASLIFFAYIGFDELGNFAEEMHHPERDLPRALFISMIVTTAIYVLVALSAAAAVGWRDLGGSDAPLALVARHVLGPRADTILTLVALCATANTVLLLLLSGARSVYGIASAGMLPARLAAVGRKTGIPVGATAVVVGVTAPFVLLGDLSRVAEMTDASVLLSFLMVNGALVWLSASRAIDRRGADLILSGAAALLCAWLLIHTGWAGLGTASALTILALFIARRATRTLA